jgi:hypothetical protein
VRDKGLNEVILVKRGEPDGDRGQASPQPFQSPQVEAREVIVDIPVPAKLQTECGQMHYLSCHHVQQKTSLLSPINLQNYKK